MTTSRPTDLQARALGPDLARGVMLLFIALANSHYFLRGTPGAGGTGVLGGYPVDGSRLDSVVVWVISTFVDGRAFPMFGLLFGYGVARIVSRQGDSPRGVGRGVRGRPAAVLVVLGLVHAVLLFAGDILGAYGVLLLLGAWVVRWKDRWLLVVGVVFLVLISLPGDGSLTTSSAPPGPEMLPGDLRTMVVDRAETSAYVCLLGPLGFFGPFAFGLLAGRRRVLERTRRYRGLLRVVAVGGVGAAVLGAQPVSLVLAGVMAPPDSSTLDLWGPLHDGTGTLGGLGYAALLALVASQVEERRGRVVTAVAAVGQRSMTCYLAQSVVWSVAFTPFLLDLSGTLSVTGVAVLACATWGLTVVMAEWMRRTGRRGPFEVLIRRVTYDRRIVGRRAGEPVGSA